MAPDFSTQENAKETLNDLLSKPPSDIDSDSIELSDEDIIQELHNAMTVMKDKVSWTKNLGMKNKKEEAQKFKAAWDNDKRYNPEFEYHSFDGNPKAFLKVLSQLNQECEKIDKATVREYNPEALDVEDFRNLFRGTFEEFKLYVRLADAIEDREAWRKLCLKIWPIDEETALESKKKLINTDFEEQEEKKELEAEDLKDMWEKELERIGVDYNVETRRVDGCFNIPEEGTVVVAQGDEQKRRYSKAEARMLTMHELFHVARSYNGKQISKEAGLPPVLGIHTPYYDKTEEGGAVYREFATNAITPSKEKDYHLRNMAAYFMQQRMEFPEIVRNLIKLGGTPTRAFGLAARNREILRHHIYLEGYYQDWKDREDLRPLLIGKVNADWAEKLWKEVEAEDGMLTEPPVTREDLFDFKF